MAFSMVWDLPAAAERIGVCRHTLKAYLAECGVCEEDIENLQLILGEACANVVRHAYVEPGQRYTVSVSHSSEKLAIDIVDHGIGFNSKNPKRRNQEEGCGAGLPMIRTLAGHADITSKRGRGTVVHVEYDLRLRDVSDWWTLDGANGQEAGSK